MKTREVNVCGVQRTRQMGYAYEIWVAEQCVTVLSAEDARQILKDLQNLLAEGDKK